MPVGGIVVLASGSGSNFQKIIDSVDSAYISEEISLLVSDKKEAYAVERARKNNIETMILNLEQDKPYQSLSKKVKDTKLIVLAGYMRVIPEDFVKQFEGRIINLHPSLLPKYGGKGMYGLKVHKEVLKNKENFSGASVHYVDSGVDTGQVICQERVNVYNGDSPEDLQKRIQKVEHRILPLAIKRIIEGEV